jgi:predicted nucleic acid-binding protein
VSIVIDASVIVAVLVADERQVLAEEQLREWLAAREELHVPAVLPYEIANVLARLVFDGAMPLNEVSEIWDDLAALRLILHPFNLAEDGSEVAAITTQLRRRHATDATYVCLARRLRTTLWTLDGPLARNAASIGLPVQLLT